MIDIIDSDSFSTKSESSSTSSDCILVNYDKSMVAIYIDVIEELIKQNSEKSKNKRKFSCNDFQQESLKEFLERIFTYIKYDDSIIITSLIYLDRISKSTIINESNVQKLVFLSIMASYKFYNDKHYNNLSLSKIANLDLKDLNKLEMKFYILLDYNLNINESDYNRYLKHIKIILN